MSAGNEQLFYWSRESISSSAEVDYLLAKNNTGKLIDLNLNFTQIMNKIMEIYRIV